MPCWPSAASRWRRDGLFGVEGTALLDRVALPAPYAARIASLRRVIDTLDLADRPVHAAGPWPAGVRAGLHQRAADPRDRPDAGGCVFVAEIGDVHRFTAAPALASWAGLTPKHHQTRHPRPPRTDHQARLLPGPLGRDPCRSRRSGPTPRSAPCANASRPAAAATSARAARRP
ncbi:transposase, partial [Nostocoides japonicum]|uniref:transposase n=1 Tax=Nostocoides japonicum TaxID=99481 RepID=UPI0012FA3853